MQTPLIGDPNGDYVNADSYSEKSGSSFSFHTSFSLPSPSSRYDAYEPANDSSLFKRSYEHFLMKGLLNIVIRDLLMIVLVLTIGAIGTVLLVFTNYDYLYNNGPGPLFKAYAWDNKAQNGLLSILWLVLGPYTLFLVAKLVHDLVRHMPIMRFYRKLGINQEDLETMEWQEVIQRIKNDYNIHYSVHKTELDIMNFIMRDENYLIGLTNAELLDLGIGFPSLLGGRHVFATEFVYKVLSSTLFSINYKNGVSNIGLDRNTWVTKLQRRFFLFGILVLIFMPAIFVVLFFYFVTRYGTQAYSDSGSVTKGKWTTYARWHLRHFNEAEHFFTNRLKRGYDNAAAYADLFPLSSHITWAARYLAYIVGFVLAVMIFFTATSPLFVFEVFGISSVTVVSILTIAFGVLLSIGPKETLSDDFAGKLSTLCVYIEYYPKDWRDKPKSPATYEDFSLYFKPRILTWIEEVVSIVFTPYIFLVKLPRCAPRIVEFFAERTDPDNKFCTFALFGSEPKKNSIDISTSADGLDAETDGNSDDDENDDSGKEERRMQVEAEEEEPALKGPIENLLETQDKKSLLCFIRDYPKWERPESAMKFISDLSNYMRSKKKTEDNTVVTNSMILSTNSELFDAHFGSGSSSSSNNIGPATGTASAAKPAEIGNEENFVVSSIYASTLYDQMMETNN